LTIHLTPVQAAAVAELAEREGDLTLHQVERASHEPAARDVYATPSGTATGYRIAPDGALSPAGKSLPAD
jgi:hypothetical protein